MNRAMTTTRRETNPLATEAVARIRVEMGARGVTTYELAKRTGISRPGISRMLNDPGHMRTDTIFVMFEALGLEPRIDAD